MRIWAPFNPEEQFNIYEFEDMVPDFAESVVISGVTFQARVPALPATSYRVRWNERTASWTADWLDEDGNPIDQGRRLSAGWFIRTPWLNGFLPDPMPAWLLFLEVGDTGAECDFDGLGVTHELSEPSAQELIDSGFLPTAPPNITVTIP
jgi:hypothetical protein